ncbi:glutathione transferase GstA [Celerinatantimonas diazotrophica]|uniref:Glutathione S-transferase n=1 Tax=Celerinatantimonas diazotrophica TaxID=412034 RepID=A0A4R1K4A0_9GAMM|nr:glutathione transferase GstA [Celerinatantimonas diazotrophica]TCK57819.1 glutathione S-transferase [Celerinatantimonas diazotrophica]CAG9298117.1 Glutathione S-transferase GST-6.0 [Celerinatantimonas diazotrophica]
MKLYYTPGACSLAPHIVLEELGVSHTLEKVDLKSKRTENNEDYLSVNDKGYVPTLRLDDGNVLTEGAVISQYLAELHPDQQLFPNSGLARYQLQSLMVYISTEIHKTIIPLMQSGQDAKSRAASEALMNKRLGWVSEKLGNREFIFGEHFSIADAYLFTTLNWMSMVKIDLNQWANLVQYQQRIGSRPAVQRALKAEGLI